MTPPEEAVRAESYCAECVAFFEFHDADDYLCYAAVSNAHCQNHVSSGKNASVVQGSEVLLLVRSLIVPEVQDLLIFVVMLISMFPRFDVLTEFSMLFYKALENDTFLFLEVTYLPTSKAANTTPANSPAIAQSISSGMCTSKRTCRPGT